MTRGTLRAICIVDDDDAVRDSLKVLLESYDLVVREFSSPLQVLEDDALKDCDCLVLDFHMPVMSGLELLEVLRARSIDIPAVMVTSNMEPEFAFRLEKANLSALLTKPVDDRNLLGQIAKACRVALP